MIYSGKNPFKNFESMNLAYAKNDKSIEFNALLLYICCAKLNLYVCSTIGVMMKVKSSTNIVNHETHCPMISPILFLTKVIYLVNSTNVSI